MPAYAGSIVGGGPQQPTRDQVRAEIQTRVRQSVREAVNEARVAQEEGSMALQDALAARDEALVAAQAGREAAREAAQAAVAPRTMQMAPPPVIDALNAQIAAQRQTIQSLTAELTPGLSDAREEAVTDQIEAAQERLSVLQEQLDRALGIARADRAMVMRPPPLPPGEMIPPEAVEMTMAFFFTLATIVIGLPLARAFARRMDRRGQVAVAAAASGTSSLEPRLDRIEQAMEAIAIEVERISEGQRFTNRVMGELRGLPSPLPVEQRPPHAAEREKVRHESSS